MKKDKVDRDIDKWSDGLSFFCPNSFLGLYWCSFLPVSLSRFVQKVAIDVMDAVSLVIVYCLSPGGGIRNRRHS